VLIRKNPPLVRSGQAPFFRVPLPTGSPSISRPPSPFFLLENFSLSVVYFLSNSNFPLYVMNPSLCIESPLFPASPFRMSHDSLFPLPFEAFRFITPSPGCSHRPDHILLPPSPLLLLSFFPRFVSCGSIHGSSINPEMPRLFCKATCSLFLEFFMRLIVFSSNQSVPFFPPSS